MNARNTKLNHNETVVADRTSRKTSVTKRLATGLVIASTAVVLHAPAAWAIIEMN